VVDSDADLLGNRMARSYANPKNLPGEHCVQHATVQIRTDAAATPSRMLHLPQELSADYRTALSAAVRMLTAGDRTRVLTMLAALGIDPERILAHARCLSKLLGKQLNRKFVNPMS
jgi:hypothetical protein